MNIESIENGIKITIDKKENHSLKELEQLLIDEMYELVSNRGFNISKIDVDILKTLFDKQDRN